MKTTLLSKIMLASAIFTASLTSSYVAAETSVWKISKGNDHIYLGGTIHILPVSEFPLPKEFTDAYQKSDAIVLEAKLPEATDTAFQMKMMQAMSYQNGQTLSGVLSKSTYQKLTAYLAGFGADINTLNGFKPGFIMTMMALLEAQKAQLSGDGVDTYFSQKASKDNKPIEYLESVDFQMNMLANIGQGYEDKFIESNLSQMDDFKGMFTKLIKSWRAGDVAALEQVVIKPLKEDPKSYKTMLVDRNKNWIPLIEQMFNDKDKEFVLVGVGHLIGDKSVVALLKRKGYSVNKL